MESPDRFYRKKVAQPENSSAVTSGSNRIECRGDSESAVFSVVGKTSLKDRRAMVDTLAIQSLP